MIDFMRAWLMAVVAGGAAALAVALIARRWRPHDAAFWHTVHTAIIAAAVVSPVAALVLPTVAVISPATERLAVAVVPTPSASLLAIGVAIYVAGVVAMAVRLTAGLLLVDRMRRRSTALEPHWAQRLARVARVDVARCRLHPRVQSAITIGWRDPVVLLPETALLWPVDRLRAVLQHEFAHIARRDYAWNLVAAVHLAMYWPSPLAWWLVRRARLNAELACDRAASREVGDTEYAQVLVQSAREFIAGGQSIVAPGADTDIFARVDALLSTAPALPAASRRVTAWTVAVIVSVMAAACVVRFVPLGSVPRAGSDHSILHAFRHGGH